eukprot:12401199-Karenia_brevis.AAC.1
MSKDTHTFRKTGTQANLTDNCRRSFPWHGLKLTRKGSVIDKRHKFFPWQGFKLTKKANLIHRCRRILPL